MLAIPKKLKCKVHVTGAVNVDKSGLIEVNMFPLPHFNKFHMSKPRRYS